MSAVLFRIALLAAGLAFGQMGLDSFVRGGGATVVQLGLALGLIVAGSAGFMAPLFSSGFGREVTRDA